MRLMWVSAYLLIFGFAAQAQDVCIDGDLRPVIRSTSEALDHLKSSNEITTCPDTPSTPPVPPGFEQGYSRREEIYKGARPLGPQKKFFLPGAQTPSAINNAVRSVRALCVCDTSNLENCVTVTAVRPGGIFVTNEHALAELFDMAKNMEGRNGNTCTTSGFFSMNNEGREISTRVGIIRRGKVAEFAQSTTIRDNSKDIAVIQLDGLADTPPLPIANPSAIVVGTKVYHAGFPVPNPRRGIPFGSAKQPVISDGKITFISGKNNEGDFLGTNGTSGGPVLNEEGAMVGLFWGKEGTIREQAFLFEEKERAQIRQLLKGTLQMPPEVSYFIPLSGISAMLR